ncbi:TQXA domain-containing protein [Streptomyces sp. AJS327]|uniref:TQXA domain-containing protein n=1 Tax=Streptomyces sp. AJS327 TaxID=2545265 RepID=UPI001C6092DB|nr:TQXA domain-containing protein [Streptomyces sp. AJS327]
MTSVRRRGTSRLSAVLMASGLLAGGVTVGATPAAAAEPTEPPSGTTAALDGIRTYDQAVINSDGDRTTTSAGLFEMAVEDGGTLQTYSIDALRTAQDDALYEEASWDASPLHGNPAAGKIRWILQNSYPQVNDVQALAKASGAKKLTPRTAAAGTQVAIWRHAEGPAGADIKAVDPGAEKLADYLERSARQRTEPNAALRLGPAEVSGQSGGRLGPVTVHTGAKKVAIEPAPDAASLGVQVVDAKGEKVTSASDGAHLYFDVPDGVDPGTTSVTAQISTKVPVGRVFTGVGEHASSQAQILAGSSQSTISTVVRGHWAENGAIPAVTAEKNCAKGRLEITVANHGDRAFAFALDRKKHEIEAGVTEKVPVTVREDQPYRIAITGPHGFEKTFNGVLDCATAGAVGARSAEESPADLSPATVGGGDGHSAADPVEDDLAETGNSSNTPLIIGIALGLVVLGGIAMLVVRKRLSGGPTEPADPEPSEETAPVTGATDRAQTTERTETAEPTETTEEAQIRTETTPETAEPASEAAPGTAARVERETAETTAQSATEPTEAPQPTEATEATEATDTDGVRNPKDDGGDLDDGEEVPGATERPATDEIAKPAEQDGSASSTDPASTDPASTDPASTGSASAESASTDTASAGTGSSADTASSTDPSAGPAPDESAGGSGS